MRSRFFNRRGRGLYRSRQGILGGVCRGAADYFDFKVLWVRAAVILMLIFTGFWPIIGIYFVAYLLMKPRPVRPIDNPEEQEFYDSYISSRKNLLHRVKRRFHNLERRIRRMEETVTDREFEWDEKLNGHP
jgi:phage shock protein C